MALCFGVLCCSNPFPLCRWTVERAYKYIKLYLTIKPWTHRVAIVVTAECELRAMREPCTMYVGTTWIGWDASESESDAFFVQHVANTQNTLHATPRDTLIIAAIDN